MNRWLTAFIAFIAMLWAIPALAQNFTVSSIGTSNAGTIAAASTGQSIFRASAASGVVTKVSGNAVRVSGGTARSLVTVACGNPNGCNTASAQINIRTTGTPSGRAAALQNFTVSTSGATATITIAPGTGSNISFRIGPIGRNSSKTFWVGYDLPINGDNSAGSTGSANSAFVVTISRTNGGGANSLSGNVGATVFRTITMSKTADLAFGRIVRPTSGGGTATLAPATGAVSVAGTGMAVVGSGSSAAAFAVAGEGGQSISFSVPSTFNLTSGANSLTVTTNPSASGAQVLSGAIGAAGSFTLKLGGTLPLSATTPSGTYTGTVSVTVAYN